MTATPLELAFAVAVNTLQWVWTIYYITFSQARHHKSYSGMARVFWVVLSIAGPAIMSAYIAARMI